MRQETNQAPPGAPGAPGAHDIMAQAGDRPLLSIIIPALNAESSLPGVLDSVQEAQTRLFSEVILVDGGSHDQTLAIAQAAGVRILASARGRGRQLHEGASVARGAWFLFLHADTRLEEGWSMAVASLVERGGIEQGGDEQGDQQGDQQGDEDRRIGFFRLHFDTDRWQARLLERIVDWRCRVLSLPYGDQGLLIARCDYNHVGGFRFLALMEDVDFISRVEHSRLVCLDKMAFTSSARYERRWLRQSFANFFRLLAWCCGVSTDWLAGQYGYRADSPDAN